MNTKQLSPEAEDEQKAKFLEVLQNCGGVIGSTCEATGIGYKVYRRWIKTDDHFKDLVDDIGERQVGFVESRLMQLINAGDPTAIIFYLKTKGKGHGYSQKNTPTEEEKDRRSEQRRRELEAETADTIEFITAALQRRGTYSTVMDIPIKATAAIYAQCSCMWKQLAADGFTIIETSREGDKRQTLSPLYVAYLRAVKQLNENLKGLGITIKPDAIPDDEDRLALFIKSINSEDDNNEI